MKRCNLIKRFFIGLLLIVVASISAIGCGFEVHKKPVRIKK